MWPFPSIIKFKKNNN